MWWSWLIARKTTARPEIEKERRSQRSMVTRIVWSRHRFWSCWSWKSFCTLKRKEESSVYSTVTTASVWSWLTSADCRGESGQDRLMADAIPELWPEDGQVYPIPGNTMEANTFQYYSEDDPTSIQCQPIPSNTTQYHTPRSDSDSKVMVEIWSRDCNSSICPGMGHLWPHNTLKQILCYIFRTNTPISLKNTCAS